MSTASAALDRQKALWDALLDADLNVRYWRHLSRRYGKINDYYRALIAFCSSASVAAWGIWIQYPYAWKTLSALSCVVSLVYPIFVPSEKLKRMSGLVGAWQQIETNYELLWARDSTFSVAGTWHDFAKAKADQAKLDETDLPNSKKLLWEAYDEVLKARGLDK